MKKIMIGALIGNGLLLSGLADAVEKPIDVKEVCSRFELTAEVFIFDKAGKKLLSKMAEKRVYKISAGQALGVEKGFACKIKSSWGSRSTLFEGPLLIESEWKILYDKTISGHIKQFKRTNKNRQNEGLVFEKNYQSNFVTPVWFKSKTNHAQTVIVRFTPNLTDAKVATDFDQMPLVGVDMQISDDEGNVWTDHLNFDAKFVAIKTYRGTVAVSYYPFKGSKLLGSAHGDRVVLNLGKGSLVFRSAEKILPGNISANIYGHFYKDKKTSSFKSVGISTSSTEDDFLDRIVR